MSSQHLLPVQSPMQVHMPKGSSLAIENSGRRDLNVGFNRMVAEAASRHENRVLPPPRRAFKKSRKGCRTSKARKCDEKHSLCGNCSRRYPGLESCDFEQFIEVAQKNSESVSTSSHQQFDVSLPSIAPSITTQPAGISHSEGSRVLELRLMHHYTTSTWKQLPDGHSRKGNYVWSMNIPQLAFKSDLVLSVLLSISALHYWALTPNNQLLSYAARYYFDRAVRDHRKALGDVDQASVEAQVTSGMSTERRLQTRRNCHAFSNFFGERSLWQRSSRVRKDRHRTIIDVSINLQQRPPSTASTTSSKNAPQAPRTFLELVESKNPRALALLARNLELLKVIRSVWWLHGTGPSQNVAEISITGIGNMLPKEWSWAMEWPLKVLSRDLRPLNSETR